MRSALSLVSYIAFCSLLWTAFSRAERLLRQRTKTQLASAIRTSRIFAVIESLPTILLPVFDSVFTPTLWSFRGFRRSALLSVVSVLLLSVWWYSKMPPGVEFAVTSSADLSQSASSYYVVFYDTEKPIALMSVEQLVWSPLIYNIVADYCAFTITRFFLTQLLPSRALWGMALMWLISIPAFYVLCVLFAEITAGLQILFYQIPLKWPDVARVSKLVLVGLSFPFATHWPVSQTPTLGTWSPHTIFGIYFYSTVVGLFWITLFSVSIFISRLAVRASVIGPWLDHHFRLGTNPLKILAGILIATLSVVYGCVYVLFVLF